MGLRSKNKKEAKANVISQVNFIEDTNSLLETATAADTPVTKAVEKARSVSSQLAAIHAGTLIIEPPLSHDQFVTFRDRSDIIISIGEKASAALAETENISEQTRAEAASPSYEGSGSGGKR